MTLLTRAIVGAAVGLTLMADVRPASTEEASAEEIKAGFLYNFAMFTEWPQLGPAAPLVIGVLGDDRLGSAAQALSGRKVNGRPLVVRNVDESDDLPRYAILYVAVADDRAAAAALARVGNAPVLTIGDTPRFAQVGGIIRLYADAGKLRFEINVLRSQQVDLRFSSRLLAVARVIRESR